jgi:two-component system, OmpR family, phosphate regulon sensor histidine kinase PhoR
MAITLVALLVAGWYFSRTMKDFYLAQLASDLTVQARLMEQLATPGLLAGDTASLDALAIKIGRSTGLRVTLILPDGGVLGDTLDDPARMDNHAERPEIIAARQQGVGTAMRYSFTVSSDMMYAAVPVYRQGELAGFVRVAIPATAIDRELRALYGRILLTGLLVTVVAALVSLGVARRISRPLEEMKRGAQRFARGELDSPLSVDGSDEIGALAEALNEMALQLDDRIRTITRQHNEQEAVLASMVEGVLAVDLDERILRINQAAAQLLGVESTAVQGRRLQEVIRKADVQRFVAETLASQQSREGEIALRGTDERFLQAHGTMLHGAEGRQIGALVVLNDITRLRRLEGVRREFVANVSHELKTPITAIKGFIETLLDGALHDPEDARRFLDIIHRQAERLNAIIDDLLALSRIEQEEEKKSIPLHKGPVEEVLRAAVQSCTVQGSAKGIAIDLHCEPQLLARLNPPLLEQALVNLIDNAIKYSDSSGRVLVEARATVADVRIAVRDWGTGIPREHLNRIFERFYRVDKARSRKQGGTGLGLAIVKHIVQAHGGRVEVISAPRQGSTFTIYLPAV